MAYAIDANLLLYASNKSSAEHKKAVQFLQACAKSSENICFAWATLMAFVRISTHPRIFPDPLTQDEAAHHVEALLALPHVRVLTELEGFWDLYTEVARGARARGNAVPDAHLAALLKQNGVRVLYSCDADFRRFVFLDVRNPLA